MKAETPKHVQRVGSLVVDGRMTIETWGGGGVRTEAGEGLGIRKAPTFLGSPSHDHNTFPGPEATDSGALPNPSLSGEFKG